MFSLKLLGGVSLEGPDGRVTGPAIQRHRLAILALLASARPRAAQSRDRLMGWLWPESDAEHARGLLNQAVHVLRRTLGAEALRSVGEDLQLDTALVACDVIGFEEAVSSGNLERAAAIYAGPFLDGFFLSDAPEFDQWLGRERDRLASSYAGVLEGLAERAETAGDRAGAVRWWKARAAQDSYDSRIALRLILALEASGNRAAALLEAGAHQRLIKDELDLEPPPDLVELTERLRSSPAPALSRRPMVPASDPGFAAPVPVPPHRATPALAVPAARRAPWYGVAALVGVVALLAVALLPRNRAPSPAAGTVTATAVDEIARAVARELERRRQGDTAPPPAAQRTGNLAAYELYLRGSDPTLIRSDSGARRGLEYFTRAVALDSGYAAAWAGLARMTLRTSLYFHSSERPRILRNAEAAARRAIALDDSLAEAHGSLGLLLINRLELVEGESALRRAVALEPRAARNYEFLVRVYVWLGRGADALTMAGRAVEVEPLSPSATAELARALLANGRYDDALAQLEKIAALDPPLQRAAVIAAQSYAGKKFWREAASALRPGADSVPQGSGLFGYYLGRSGQKAEARRILERLLEQNRTRGGQAVNLALVHAGLGETGETVTWLERAIADRLNIPLSEAAYTVAVVLDSLPRDSRVVALRRALGLQNR
jgi:DNA-binding SARP family transcriptional activator/Tfp pilus assembly protein PilF